MEGLVVFGDVIGSRRDSPGATTWLRLLTAELATAYPAADRLAEFEFTQGDELQGLLAVTTDPFAAILRAALHPERVAMRWVIVRGEVDPGTGPATQRSGPAFFAARERLATASARRELVAARVGDDDATNATLDTLAPLLGELLRDLTDRQREIAWPLLVEGRRSSEAAARLGVSRATVSVAADRAHLRSIGQLAGVIRRLLTAERVTPR